MNNKQHEILTYANDLGLNPDEITDGYYTFKELYNIRLAYNVALFNHWGKGEYYSYTPLYNVHKSWKHYDGEKCFGGGWFIVVAQLPSGQISNHYEAIHWDKFCIPSTDKALFPYDEHSTNDVIERLINL